MSFGVKSVTGATVFPDANNGGEETNESQAILNIWYDNGKNLLFCKRMNGVIESMPLPFIVALNYNSETHKMACRKVGDDVSDPTVFMHEVFEAVPHSEE